MEIFQGLIQHGLQMIVVLALMAQSEYGNSLVIVDLK
jgi:hypothetical protein